MQGEKKVIMVILEGPSDESALGGILKEYFSSEEVQFALVHGDITSDYNIKSDTVINKINELIEQENKKYGYKWEDLKGIIHIIDTDGAFAKKCIFHADVESVKYYIDHIEASNVENIEKRNAHKSEILRKLISISKIHEIKYKIYFNSCNLEHVLYDKLEDFTDEEKEMMADDFSDQYENNLKDFIAFISDDSFAVEGTYKQTWNFIQKNTNSLQRHTNIHLIFK